MADIPNARDTQVENTVLIKPNQREIEQKLENN